MNRELTMKVRVQWFAIVFVAASATAAADTLRDPTVAPLSIASPTTATRDPLEDIRPEHIVIVGGVRYLVWQSRRYAVGEEIAGAKIERILENAVWLKSKGVVRKLMLFPNIEMKPSSGEKTVTASGTNASASNPASASTPTKTDGKNGLKK